MSTRGESTVGRRSDWYIAGYASMPKGPWDPAVEKLLFDSYRSTETDICWEIPYTNSLHPHDELWFLQQVRPREKLVVTTIPGVMEQLSTDPEFGLASIEERGRRRAVDFMADVLTAVRRANAHLGRGAITAVELHSAPRSAIGSSVEAFTRSLEELASWDWQGAELLIEHCDAAAPGFPASKGFLHLESEIEICEKLRGRSATPVGICINWARSVIESRDVAAAVRHVQIAREADLLRGFMFSGCSPLENSRGGPWADFHLPPQLPEEWAEKSLLDENAIASVLDALEDTAGLILFGMKVSCPPDSSLNRRIEIVNAACKMLVGASLAASTRTPGQT